MKLTVRAQEVAEQFTEGFWSTWSQAKALQKLSFYILSCKESSADTDPEDLQRAEAPEDGTTTACTSPVRAAKPRTVRSQVDSLAHSLSAVLLMKGSSYCIPSPLYLKGCYDM